MTVLESESNSSIEPKTKEFYWETLGVDLEEAGFVEIISEGELPKFGVNGLKFTHFYRKTGSDKILAIAPSVSG